MSQILAVDFDNTLSLGAEFPNVGKPNKPLFDYLKSRQHNGDRLILWTCRTDDALDLAISFCRVNGLTFNYVNENPPDIIEKFGGDTRKIFANLYIDDAGRPWWDVVQKPPKPEKPKRQPRSMKILR